MRFRTSIVVSTLVVVSVTLAAGPRTNAQTQALSDDEIRARTKQLLANQHDDDDALELYERVERRINRTGGANPRTIDDKTYRVVPTGAGSQKILLHEEGKSTDSAAYARQMQVLKDLLTIMANPNDPKAKAGVRQIRQAHARPGAVRGYRKSKRTSKSG